MASIVEQWLAFERVLRFYLSQYDGVISSGIRRDDTAIDESQAVVEDWSASGDRVRGDPAEAAVALHRVSSKAGGEILLLATEEVHRKDPALDQRIVYMAGALNAD
jgi:hypothetical protein